MKRSVDGWAPSRVRRTAALKTIDAGACHGQAALARGRSASRAAIARVPTVGAGLGARAVEHMLVRPHAAAELAERLTRIARDRFT